MQGECSKCKSTNLDYGERVDADNSIGYEFKCDDCGCTGVEWYELAYSETIMDGEEKCRK